MKKSRWFLISLAVLLIASLALAACQPAAEEAVVEEAPAEEAAPVEEEAAPAEEEAVPAEEEAAPAEEEEDSKVGGTLIFAITADPDTLDPAKTGSGISDLVMGFLGCSLVTYDAEGTVKPYVATDWTVSEDGLTYTFNLRDDVKYHNGKPVTAHDFAFEYLRALDPATASPSTGASLASVETITALDDYTLEFKLSTPNFPFLFSISDPGYMYPINQEDFEAMGEDAFGRAPIGCGPYKFVEWQTGSKVVVERNPDFNWGPEGVWENTGPWYIEQIEFRVIPELATITAGLEAGEIHLASITQNDKDYLSTLDVVKIEGALQPGLRPYVAINTSHAPFDDVNVRKAFNLALDREAAVQVLVKGDAVVQYGPLSPAQIGYWDGVEQLGYGYDLEQAAALMEESGYVKDADGYWGKDGQRISLTLYTLPIETWVRAAELVQQQYKQFGLELTIAQEEQGVVIPLVLGGEYDITMFGMTSPEADILWMMFHSSQVGGFNYAFVEEPDLDVILDRTRTETDPIARQEAVNDAQRYIIEQAYTIPLYAPINYMAISSDIIGYRFSDIRSFDLDSAYFAE